MTYVYLEKTKFYILCKIWKTAGFSLLIHIIEFQWILSVDLLNM